MHNFNGMRFGRFYLVKERRYDNIEQRERVELMMGKEEREKSGPSEK